MRGAIVKFSKVFRQERAQGWKVGVALGAIGLTLSGCVVYPSSGYGYGGGGYYAAPAYYAAPVVVGVGGGWGWGGGWHGG